MVPSTVQMICTQEDKGLATNIKKSSTMTYVSPVRLFLLLPVTPVSPL